MSVKIPWRQAVSGYQKPAVRRSIWQLVNTLVPYFGLWTLMIWSLEVSYWLTLALAVPAAGLLVRVFIFFHDCGHGSFFNSPRANHTIGFFLGVLVFTPYFYWRQSHAIHHATAGNLDKRGVGDVWTMTLQEYLQAPFLVRLAYRVFRHPLVMFGVGPLIVFVLTQRVPSRKYKKRERMSIHWTNLALVTLFAVMGLFIGIKNFIIIQLPVIWMAATIGVWLFYIQHQFEGVYWERAKEWDFVQAGLQGSSFYKLPKLLQWFTGNIGFHHIHHLSPKIPNYLLEKCHHENSIFQVRPIRFMESLKSLTLSLWDEQNRKLVSFKALRSHKAIP